MPGSVQSIERAAAMLRRPVHASALGKVLLAFDARLTACSACLVGEEPDQPKRPPT